ncbi:MAG: hypothetical protein K2O41_03160 [Clostridia bacterium]|nr:hypothetical protein [Clostridia bacterium]
MVLCVAADKSIKDIKSLPKCDIAVFGFRGLGEVDYEQELKGLTDKFEDAARLSKSADCGVLTGCKTISRGLVRKSVAAAYGGKLLGISDMTHVLDNESFKSGAGLGVYSLGGYKIGLCIENDLLFPETVKVLSLCGCNAVVVFMEELKDTLPPLLIRSYSYLYGVPIIMCAGNTACYAEVSGEIATSAQPYALYDVSLKNRYRVVTTRIKGLCADGKEDY